MGGEKSITNYSIVRKEVKRETRKGVDLETCCKVRGESEGESYDGKRQSFGKSSETGCKGGGGKEA